MAGFDLGKAFAESVDGYPYFGSEKINLPSGRTISDGAILASGAPPYSVTSAYGRIVWGANAATTTGVEWDIAIPGEFMTDKPAIDDELRVLLIIKSGAAGSNAAIMNPTILYQRAGIPISASIPLTAYKKALTVPGLQDVQFTSGATFTCTDLPTSPEAVLLQFRNTGLRAFDAARLTIAPSVATNHVTSLFGAWLLPQRNPSIALLRK